MGPMGSRGDPGFEGPMVSCRETYRLFFCHAEGNCAIHISVSVQCGSD